MTQNTANDTRNWRDSKIPQWAKAQIQQELITGALRWPSEPKPQPLSFGYGSHDSMVGSVIAGTYWRLVGDTASKFVVRPALKDDKTYKRYVFNRAPDNPLGKFSDEVVRGPWFKTEREACLFALWDKCEDAAKVLYGLHQSVLKLPLE